MSTFTWISARNDRLAHSYSRRPICVASGPASGLATSVASGMALKTIETSEMDSNA